MFRRRAFAVLPLALLLSGCADNRIKALEETVGRHKSDLEAMRTIQAENTAAINDLRSDLGRLTGKMEEVQYVAKGKTEELQRTLEAVTSRVPPPPGVPEDLLNADDEMISRISGAAADAYRTGLRQIRSGDFEAARATFAAFVDSNPQTAFTDNAFFWIGVAHERLGQPDRAASAYSEAFQRFPAEDRVAPALYKLAELFEAMGSRKDAVVTLQKLVDEHGSSDYGRRGRELLNQLAPPAKKKAAAPVKAPAKKQR